MKKCNILLQGKELNYTLREEDSIAEITKKFIESKSNGLFIQAFVNCFLVIDSRSVIGLDFFDPAGVA